MTRYDRRRCDMLTRVRDFGATHGQLLPTSSTAHEAFARVAAEVAQLEALDVTARAAVQASRAATTDEPWRTLTGTLMRAANTARVLAGANPAIEGRGRAPLPTGDLELLAEARQLAARASPYADQFAAHGIVLAELEADSVAFEQALHQRKTGRDEQTRLRAEIKAAFARALKALAILDVSVVNGFASNPVTLAVWKRDRRVASRRRSTTPESEPDAPMVQDPEPTASAEPVAIASADAARTAA